MTPNATLEALSFKPFIVNENMNDNNQNPDLIFFHKIALLLLTQITYRQEILRVSLKIIPNAVSVLHLNIRSLSKNFESFKELYNLLSFKFIKYAFQKHGRKMEKLMKTHFIS